LEEATPVEVGVCYSEASRVCDKEDLQKRKRSMGDFQFDIANTCIDVFETGELLLFPNSSTLVPG